MRRKIQNLVDNRNFDALLELHELLYDLSRDLPQDDATPVICNTPSLVAPQESQAKYDMRRKKQHIDIFYEVGFRIASRMLIEHSERFSDWLITHRTTFNKPYQAIFKSDNMSSTKMWHNELAICFINTQ